MKQFSPFCDLDVKVWHLNDSKLPQVYQRTIPVYPVWRDRTNVSARWHSHKQQKHIQLTPKLRVSLNATLGIEKATTTWLKYSDKSEVWKVLLGCFSVPLGDCWSDRNTRWDREHSGPTVFPPMFSSIPTYDAFFFGWIQTDVAAMLGWHGDDTWSSRDVYNLLFFLLLQRKHKKAWKSGVLPSANQVPFLQLQVDLVLLVQVEQDPVGGRLTGHVFVPSEGGDHRLSIQHQVHLENRKQAEEFEPERRHTPPRLGEDRGTIPVWFGSGRLWWHGS